MIKVDCILDYLAYSKKSKLSEQVTSHYAVASYSLIKMYTEPTFYLLCYFGSKNGIKSLGNLASFVTATLKNRAGSSCEKTILLDAKFLDFVATRPEIRNEKGIEILEVTNDIFTLFLTDHCRVSRISNEIKQT